MEGEQKQTPIWERHLAPDTERAAQLGYRPSIGQWFLAASMHFFLGALSLVAGTALDKRISFGQPDAPIWPWGLFHFGMALVGQSLFFMPIFIWWAWIVRERCYRGLHDLRAARRMLSLALLAPLLPPVAFAAASVRVVDIREQVTWQAWLVAWPILAIPFLLWAHAKALKR